MQRTVQPYDSKIPRPIYTEAECSYCWMIGKLVLEKKPKNRLTWTVKCSDERCIFKSSESICTLEWRLTSRVRGYFLSDDQIRILLTYMYRYQID